MFSSVHQSLQPNWPLQFCLASTAAVYIVSVITGNVSQIDRVWTILPTVYTAYWALLPLWPAQPILPLWPYAPKDIPAYLTEHYSPRALLMLSLVVRRGSCTDTLDKLSRLIFASVCVDDQVCSMSGKMLGID